MLSEFTTFLRKESKRWVEAVESHLPLFILLCLYMTIPAYYEPLCNYVNIFSVIIVAFTQTFVFSAVLVRIAAQRKWLYWLVLTSASLFFFGETVSVFIQQSRFTTRIMYFVLQTNPREVSEFLQDAKSVKALIYSSAVLASILALYWLTCRMWARKRSSIVMRLSLPLKAIFLIGLSLLSIANIVYVNQFYSDVWDRHHRLYKCSTPLVYKFIWQDVLNDTRYSNLGCVERAIDNLVITHSADSINVIYVIGESHSKSRSSIYGYSRKTTPRIESLVGEGSAIALSDVISHHCYTMHTYPELLSVHCVDDTLPWHEYPLLPAVFKKAGYHVAYYSNQSLINSKKFDFTHQFFFGRAGICQKSFDENNDSLYEYDIDFINSLHPTLSSKNFIIYHLMGQHANYSQRFPESYAIYGADDYSDLSQLSQDKLQMMADFDNAILYNDLVIYTIIQKYKDTPSILFYMPDHAEECYDFRDSYGRAVQSYNLDAVKFASEVPAYIWVSEKYRQRYPDRLKKFCQTSNRPIYNSDIVHTILDASDIESPSFDLRYSLLRDSIARPHRMIYSTIDYDAVKDSINAISTYY